MEIARRLAGFSLGGADLLRRAMGKKIQAEMDAQKPLFLDGAKSNGVPKAKAEEVWNLLDKFANYGFNKSHAAAYAMVSYQTAWLKANHPVEFMAAVMNCDIHLTDKLAQYKQEVDRLGIPVLPPCVNRSEATFTVQDGKIVYALADVEAFAAEMRPLGIANFLYSDGEFVFAHGHRRTQADGTVAPPGLWLRHRRRNGLHVAAIAPPSVAGVTIHQDDQPADDAQEMTLLASVPVTGGHWSPLAEGEIAVVSAGKLVV